MFELYQSLRWIVNAICMGSMYGCTNLQVEGCHKELQLLLSHEASDGSHIDNVFNRLM